MTLIQSRVSKELKEAFSNYCIGENTTEAKMIRRLIEQLVKTNFGNISVSNNTAKSNQIKIRLNDKMISKVDDRLALEGYETRTDWVRACVLASLNNTAVLTKDEQKVLRQSNTELAAIGRNLNQIARQMNKDVFNNHQVLSDTIDEIIADIDEIKKSVAHLIRKNVTRWA